MQDELNLPPYLETQLHDVISKVLENTISNLQPGPQKKWMSIKEGAAYAGVAVNTFNKFRLRGLKVSEIVGVIRVSKEEIDNFFNANSF